MAFKYLIFTGLLAYVNAGNIIGAPLAAPIAYASPIARVAAPLAVAKAVVPEPYDPNPQYSFGYDVQDPLTGDSKGQVETRNGDLVQGSYNLIDSDGTRRIVDYQADPVNGFNAIVRKEPLAAKAVVAAPVVAKVAAPLIQPAPLLRAAPLIQSAPLLRSAPIAAAPLISSGPFLRAAPLGATYIH